MPHENIPQQGSADVDCGAANVVVETAAHSLEPTTSSSISSNHGELRVPEARHTSVKAGDDAAVDGGSLLAENKPDVRFGSPEDVATEDEGTVYATTRRRFLVAAVFALFGFINQVQYVGYATIVRESEAKFGVNALEVNILSLLIPVVYCLGLIPGCWLYSKIGFRYGMIVGGGANAFASLLKLIAVWAPKYPLVVVAQVFVAIGQILYQSLPPLLAARWFPVAERTVATAVCSLTGFAGMAVGMFVPPRIVHLPDRAGVREWGGLIGTQLGISALVVALMVFFVPEKPKHEPSKTSDMWISDKEIWKALRRPFRNLNVMLLTVFFGLPVGFLTAVAAVLTQVVEPFGISESHAGILAFAGILGGAANCILVGYVVGRLRRYKVPALILLGGVLALAIPIVVLMKTVDNNAFTIAIYILLPLEEFLVIPLVPVTMEFAVELTYPEPETVASAVVLLSMCFFSFVGMIVFTFVLGDEPGSDDSFIVFLIVVGLCAVGFVGLCFVKEDRRRYARDCGLLAQVHEPAEE